MSMQAPHWDSLGVALIGGRAASEKLKRAAVGQPWPFGSTNGAEKASRGGGTLHQNEVSRMVNGRVRTWRPKVTPTDIRSMMSLIADATAGSHSP